MALGAVLGGNAIGGDMSKLGLSIESAASIIMRDTMTRYFTTFSEVLVNDPNVARTVVAALVDGLAGACAYAIAGRLGSKEDVIEMTIKQLRECVDRDLQHLGRKP